MNGTEGATLGAIIEGIKNTTIETAAENIKNTPAPKKLNARAPPAATPPAEAPPAAAPPAGVEGATLGAIMKEKLNEGRGFIDRAGFHDRMAMTRKAWPQVFKGTEYEAWMKKDKSSKVNDDETYSANLRTKRKRR